MDVLVAYGACKKNQNHTSTTPVLDGCMEFSSSYKGERKCEACGCHRSFHERIILMRDQNGTISCASQVVLPELGPFHLQSSRAVTSTGNKDSPSSDITTYLATDPQKRRKLDELPGEDAYSDFVASRGALVPTNVTPTNVTPLQTLDLHAIEHERAETGGGILRSGSGGLGGGWLCEADKEKLLGYNCNSNIIAKKEGTCYIGSSSSNSGSSSSQVPPEKLASFFERLQREHPESPLKLEYVDGSWRVLCGVCARYLRADKKGESLHNIQKQHFVTPKHISNLKAKLEAPDEMEFWLKRMAKLREKRAQQRAQQHRYITAS